MTTLRRHATLFTATINFSRLLRVMLWSVLLKRLRQRLNITQEELAVRIGRDPNTISRWERGRLVPNQEAQADLRQLMGHEPLLSNLRIIEHAPTCTRYSPYLAPWHCIACSPSYALLHSSTPKNLRDKSLWETLPENGRIILTEISEHSSVVEHLAVNVDATMPFKNGSLRIWGQAFLMDFWRFDLSYSSEPMPPLLRVSTLEQFDQI